MNPAELFTQGTAEAILVGLVAGLGLALLIGGLVGFPRRPKDPTRPDGAGLARTYGQRAGDVMASRVVTVRDTDPVITALTLSATKHLKRPPVVDAQGKLVGVVGRPALLAASLDLRIGNART